MNPETSISEVAFAEGQRLARDNDPNICAVGYGVKLREGAPVAGDCLVFMVRAKLGSRGDITAAGSWAIPERVGGFVTDVVEVGGALAAASADRSPPAGDRGTRFADPLLGGVATAAAAVGGAAPGPGGYGTLGGRATDTVTRAPLVLSNAHVWGTAAGAEVLSPVMAAELLGAAVVPALASGTPQSLALTRVPPALAAPVVFANAFAQTNLVTGGDQDPTLFGQAGTPVPGTTRTTSEEVTIAAPAGGLPPAGRPSTPVMTWTYKRFSSTAVLQASTTTPQTQPRFLTARRMFTDATTYAGSNLVQLYGEIIPSTGLPAPASGHYALALLYPLVAGAPSVFVPRAMQPVPRRTVTTVTSSFAGFPAPARLGPAVLPVTVGTAPATFTIDGAENGDFLTPAAGTVPAGSFVLRPANSGIRIFVPPSTTVEIDIDLRNTTGSLACFATSSAGQQVANGTQSAGTSGRTKVTVSASDIAEVFVGGVTGAQLVGVTARRASPESTAPLSYGATALASELGAIVKGKWGASLFVQSLPNGTPVSANVVQTAIGSPSLLVDCFFDIN